MLDLLDQIVRRADAGEAVAACALVAARGSTPQKPPAMMLVLADGRAIGTIGGGCVEAEVRARALRALAAAVADGPVASSAASVGRRMTFRLDQDLGWDDGLVCGGTMEVVVQVVASAADAAPYRAARDALADGRSATLRLTSAAADGEPATKAGGGWGTGGRSASAGEKADGGGSGGAAGSGAEEKAASGVAAAAAAAAGRPFVHALALEPTPTLVIAGAGHVGQALAAIAAVAGFAVTVVDDRPDLASAERFPGARRVVGPIDATLARLVPTPRPGGPGEADGPANAYRPADADRTADTDRPAGASRPEHTYVVIVTRGHRHDAAALAAVVRSPARYVGLIGSRRKVVTIFRDLHRQGVTPEQLGRVRAPVGLAVGAVTAGEIAVSIAAELVAARRRPDDPPGGTMRLAADALAGLFRPAAAGRGGIGAVR